MMKKILLSFAFVAIACSVYAQSTESLKVTHGPWLQNQTSDGVTVCWMTNLPAVPGVLVSGLTPAKDSLVRNSTDGMIDAGGILHKVRITGLKPGNRYSYRLFSVELMKFRPYQVYYGDTVRSKAFDFRTADPSAPDVNFMIVNDIHTNGGKLATFLRDGNAAGQDLLIYNGDILDDFEQETELLGPIIDTSVRYFATGVPFFFVRGNHETRGIMARKLKSYLDLPGGRYYYSFTDGQVRFVMLDCGEDKPDDNRYYYGLADYDRYRLQELEWLKEELASPLYRDAAFRVIVIHMPVMGGDRAGYGPNFLAEHFGPVIRKAGADLMVAAHTHRHAWYDSQQSGLGFPMLVNGNTNYVVAASDGKVLDLKVLSGDGQTILSKELRSRK
jgi:hypothetical protein